MLSRAALVSFVAALFFMGGPKLFMAFGGTYRKFMSSCLMRTTF